MKDIKIDSNLLKEAIADAKAVKETAMQNAKIALQEAFTPQLQSMLSTKIQNEIEGEEEEEETNDVDTGEENTEIDGEPVNTNPACDTGAGEEFNDNLDSEETGETGETGETSDEGDEDDFEFEALIRELEDETEESDDEINIDDLDIEEVVNELADSSDIGKSDNKKPTNNANDSSNIGKKKEKMIQKENDEEEDIDIDEILREIDTEGDDTNGEEMEEIDIDELLREIDAEENVNETETCTECDQKIETLTNENKNLKKALIEHQDAVKFMKSKINEINLLNAKLLYTNKLFKSNTLTEEQKHKVIDSFDRAKTLRETKLLYVTMMESFDGTITPQEDNTIEKINENASASKPIGTTKSQNIIAAGETLADKFRRLAFKNPGNYPKTKI